LTDELSASKRFCDESALIQLRAGTFASLDVADTGQMVFTNSLSDSGNFYVSFNFPGTLPLKTIAILPSVAFDIAGYSTILIGSVSLRLTAFISISDSLKDYTEKFVDSSLLQQSFPYDFTAIISISIEPAETFQFGIANLFADSVNLPQYFDFAFSIPRKSPELVDSITFTANSEY
jgi:hypothetical protein